MDWNGVYSLLAQRMDSLSHVVANIPEERAAKQRELFRIEIQERPTIDAAAKEYARSGVSPLLTPNQSILLYIRIGHAAQFAELLASAMAGNMMMFPEYYTDSQMANVLEFLLVDYWAFAGNSRWRTT